MNEKLEIQQLLEQAQIVRVKDITKSLELSNRALQLAIDLKDQSLTGLALSRIGFYQMIIGEHNFALSNSNKAIQIFTQIKDDKGRADAQYTIGSVYYKQDNLHLGLRYILECIAIYTKFNDQASLAKCYKAVGTIYECFNDLEKAIDANLKSVAAAEAIGDVNLKSNAFNPLSGLYLNQGRIEEAVATIEESIAIKTETGDIRGLAFALYGRAKIYLATGKFALAEKDFLEAIDIHLEMGEIIGPPLAFLKLGSMYAKQGLLEKAEKFANDALAFSSNHGIKVFIQKATYLLYRIAKQKGDIGAALEYLEKYSSDAEENLKDQTQQIVDCYTEISRMEASAMEDRLQIERNEMVEKKNKAEYAAQVKADFLSTMSHEIRTPLNAVITISNILKGSETDTDDQTLIQSLRFASNNLLLLINDILDFSKLESAKIELEPRPANLPELVRNIHQTYLGLAKDKGLIFDVDIDKELAETYEVDSIKMSQVLGNLVSNAIKFTTKGSVKLSLELKQKRTHADDIYFSITDTGEGISDDFRSEIFESFAQPKGPNTKKSGGSGLGLAIVKKIVELFGSKISFVSQERVGSTFFFTISVKRSDVRAVHEVEESKPMEQLKVLLVEDNALNRLVASKLLAKWGATADMAETGIDALESAKQRKYDLILMDIHMPLMNGYDAAKAIKAIGKNMETPIYALTADIMAHAQEDYKDYFTGFLRKPIEQAHLREVLQNAVN